MYEGHLIRERKGEHTRALLTALAVQAGTPAQSREGARAQSKAWQLLQEGLQDQKPAKKRAELVYRLTQAQYHKLARNTGKTPEECREEVESGRWKPPVSLFT